MNMQIESRSGSPAGAGAGGPRSFEHVPALDGVRGVAILLVFWQHYFRPETSRFGGNWGWIGVEIFFVLSGFLITGILWDSRERLHRARDFYVRRALRIFPLYYAVWAGLLLSVRYVDWQWSDAFLLWPLHLGNYARFIFFDPGDVVHMDLLRRAGPGHLINYAVVGHFWSLCLEEQFYLIWPWFVFRARSIQALQRLCVAAIVLCPLARAVLFAAAPAAWVKAELLYRFTPVRVDALAMGGLLALVLRSQGRDRLVGLSRGWVRWMFAGFGLFVLMYKGLVCRAGSPSLGEPVMAVFGLSVCDLFGLALVLAGLRQEGMLARWMRWRPLRLLGRISYGFYVFHDLPQALYGNVAYKFAAQCHLSQHLTAIRAVTAFAGTLALSALSYRFLERPFLSLKVYFASGDVPFRPVWHRWGRDRAASA